MDFKFELFNTNRYRLLLSDNYAEGTSSRCTACKTCNYKGHVVFLISHFVIAMINW